MLAPPLRTARKPTRPRPALARNEFTTPAERAREARWWATYAWIEERFYWVLPPDLQPLARRRYVQRIADFLHDAVHVIDYGCGNGWIARALARRVRARVTGLDFSPAQIALARATEVPAGARIDFQSLAGPQDLPVADAYLFHGVLHHLPAAEIHDLMNQVQRLAPRGARLVFVEPACFTGQPVGDAQRALLDRIQVQVEEPAAALRRLGRVPSATVQRLRGISSERWWGEQPCGPSPSSARSPAPSWARWSRIISNHPNSRSCSTCPPRWRWPANWRCWPKTPPSWPDPSPRPFSDRSTNSKACCSRRRHCPTVAGTCRC